MSDRGSNSLFIRFLRERSSDTGNGLHSLVALDLGGDRFLVRGDDLGLTDRALVPYEAQKADQQRNYGTAVEPVLNRDQ
jgi:hypothetical protein